MHKIDRQNTHKMDRIKEYSESMYKIKDMRRQIKWLAIKTDKQ